MSLTPAQMDRMIDEHFAYEAKDDIDGVLGTLAPEAVHDVVGWPTGPSHGREEARRFYTRLFADVDEGKVTCLRRLYGENFLVDESEWEGTARGCPFGFEGKDRPLKMRILHVMEFTDDEKIAREQVWIDMASVMQQLPQGE